MPDPTFDLIIASSDDLLGMNTFQLIKLMLNDLAISGLAGRSTKPSTGSFTSASPTQGIIRERVESGKVTSFSTRPAILSYLRGISLEIRGVFKQVKEDKDKDNDYCSTSR